MRLALLAAVFAAPLLLAPQARAEDLTGTLAKIKETGTIVMGIRDSSVPFSYIDDKQQVVGYAIDICKKIVERHNGTIWVESSLAEGATFLFTLKGSTP